MTRFFGSLIALAVVWGLATLANHIPYNMGRSLWFAVALMGLMNVCVYFLVRERR